MVVYFKDWADIESHYDERFDLTGLTEAEQELKDAVASGQTCIPDEFVDDDISKNLPKKPEDWSKPDPTRHIRADVLRFVLLQQVQHERMTEAGTQLYGAQITGTLDLDDATVHKACSLIACRFEKALDANRSQFHSNALLDYSIFPALVAMGAKIAGQLTCRGARFEAVHAIALDLHGAHIGGDLLMEEVTAASTIDIRGATIKRQLDCTGARLETTDGIALDLQGAQIGDHVFLCDVTAASTIDIMGASIKGQLNCTGARLEAATEIALNLQGAQISDGFFFRKVRAIIGAIDLSDAKASLLADDAESWALVNDLILDGFHYERIEGSTDRIFSKRMEWLEKGSHFIPDDKKPDERVFFPQPYTQLADTYKRAGHDREARDVRIALAKKLNDHIRKDLIVPPNGDISVGFKSAACDIWIGILWFWHKLQLLLTGYGFKPQRALYALVLLVVACWGITYKAWHAGDFTPNSDVILLSEDWGKFKTATNHAKAWEESQAGKDWESFSPIAYAADIVIPIVDFGQTQAWAPSTNRGTWGYHLWWARWVFTSMGWIVTALGAAAITGVIRRE